MIKLSVFFTACTVIVVKIQNIFFPGDPENCRGDFVIDEEIVSYKFIFFVTTRRLLLFSLNVKLVLQRDATYSVNLNGFPVTLIGTSDCNRSF